MEAKPSYEELEQRVQKLEHVEFEHKLAEKALRESEERYRSIVENARELIWQTDPEGKFVFFNKYAEQVSGHKSADWQGKHYKPFVHPDELAHVNKILEDVLAGNIIEFKTRILNKEGEIVDLEIQTTPIYIKGEVTGTLGFGRDITKRKRAEESLRESEERFKDLANLLPQPVWETDLEGNFTYANQAGYETLGYTPKDLEEGVSVTDVIAPENRERIVANFGKTLRRIEFEDHEYTCLTKDGRKFPALIYSSPIIKDGEPSGVRGVTLDITDRKLAELALIKKGKELEEKTYELEEVNAALKVLLKHRDQDKKDFEQKIVANVKKLVLPYVEKLNNSRMNDRQMVYLNIIKSNLEDIIAPFLHQLSSKYSDLTPNEIQVAGFVKEGKTTKEIAELLNSSKGAIDFHRNNLRKKLGLRNTKTNLRAFLLTLT